MPTDRLTHKQIDALTGQDLSDAVALYVMGWRRIIPVGHGWEQWSGSDYRGTKCGCWHPHTDRNDAHRVLLRCEKLGIETAVESIILDSFPLFRPWQTLTIDPAIVCRAVLKAVMG